MTVDGNINQSGGLVEFFGSSFNSTPGTTVSAGTVVLAPSNSTAPITLVGSGGTANGFAISSDFLNHISANVLEIGSWSNSGGITISGNADLSSASIGTIYALTAGSYVGTSASMNLAPNMSLWCYANTANTGNVSGGNQAAFICTGHLDVDGKVQSGNVIFSGNPIVYESVSFSQPAYVKSAVPVAAACAPKHYRSWLRSGTELGSLNDSLFLEHGEAIISAENNTEIRTQQAVLSLMRGAIVMITTDGYSTSVKVLHNRAKGSVRIQCTDYRANLEPGYELMVSNSIKHIQSRSIRDRWRRAQEASCRNASSLYRCKL